MDTGSQNFIIGLVSALALSVGLIYTFISIHKSNLEIRKLNLENQKSRGVLKNNSASRPKMGVPSFFISLDLIIDALFFLLFLAGSINATVQYLANEVPTFALVSGLIFVLIYSYILIINKPRAALQIASKNELRYFKAAGFLGMFISLILFLLLGIQRLSLLLFSTTPYDMIISKLFSLVVNLVSVPLLLFTLISLHRIVNYISAFLIRNQRTRQGE